MARSTFCVARQCRAGQGSSGGQQRFPCGVIPAAHFAFSVFPSSKSKANVSFFFLSFFPLFLLFLLIFQTMVFKSSITALATTIIISGSVAAARLAPRPADNALQHPFGVSSSSSNRHVQAHGRFLHLTDIHVSFSYNGTRLHLLSITPDGSPFRVHGNHQIRLSQTATETSEKETA